MCFVYNFLVKYLPSWFPGGEFKSIAREWRKDVEQLRDGPYEAVRQQLVSKNTQFSYLKIRK